MPATAWIAAGVLAGVALMLLVLLRALAARGRDADRRTDMLTGGEVPLLSARRANLVGLGSRGSAQVRGAGRLVLTPTRLVFAQWVPRKDIVIPRERIIGADTTRRHAGKATAARMLRVRFTTDDGREDAAAWHVPDLPSWLAEIGGAEPGEGATPSAPG